MQNNVENEEAMETISQDVKDSSTPVDRASPAIQPSSARVTLTQAMEVEMKNGLRNFWYAIISSKELPSDAPLPVTRLGEAMVLWRDNKGEVHLFKDRCQHRGARLSLGKLRGDKLECWYHGWQYDGSGQCVLIPTEGVGCPLASRMRVKSYPVVERGGMIFAYLSSDGRAPDKPCPSPKELDDPEWNGFNVPHLWPGVNWIRATENVVDLMHAPFAHAGTYTLGRPEQLKIIEDTLNVRETDYGFIVERSTSEQSNFNYGDFHVPNWIVVDIPYPWSAGPGGPMRGIVFITPIDADNTLVYIVRRRHITGWKWWIWWALWQIRLRKISQGVQDQDEILLRSQQGPLARSEEHLAQSDIGVARLRRTLAAEWMKQRKDQTADA
jgi:phenylpropionate dioxygenase-like ring-hydroxylating dioxygenase large terminal subunit